WCNLGVGFRPLPVEWPYGGAVLNDVVAPSTSEAWAAGYAAPSFRPFVTHLVDRTFRIEPVPDLPNGSISAITMAGKQPLAVGEQGGSPARPPLPPRTNPPGC